MGFPGVRWCSRVRAGVTAPCPHDSHWEHLLIHHILDKSLSAEMPAELSAELPAELSAELPAELSAELSPARHQSARDAKGMVLIPASRAGRAKYAAQPELDARKTTRKLASRARRTESSTHSDHDARKKSQILASRAQGNIARVKAHRQIHMVNST